MFLQLHMWSMCFWHLNFNINIPVLLASSPRFILRNSSLVSVFPCLLTLKLPERHLPDSVSVITPFMAGWAAVPAFATGRTMLALTASRWPFHEQGWDTQCRRSHVLTQPPVETFQQGPLPRLSGRPTGLQPAASWDGELPLLLESPSVTERVGRPLWVLFTWSSSPQGAPPKWVAGFAEAPVTVLQRASSDARSLSVFLRLGNSCHLILGERSEPTSQSQIVDYRILAFSASFQLAYRTCPQHYQSEESFPMPAALIEGQGLVLRGSSLLTGLIVWFGFGLSRWRSGKEPSRQCRRHRCESDPWVRKLACRRKQQPPPVFSPGESHGQRSLAGYSPWSRICLSAQAQFVPAAHSAVLAWGIPWTEEPGRLRSIGSQRVGYNWATQHIRTQCPQGFQSSVS